MKRFVNFAALALLVPLVVLAGCGAPELNYSAAARQQQTDTGIRIGDSESGIPTEPSVEYVRVTMDKSVFLDPPEVDDPQVYVRVRDTSGQDWDLQYEVEDILKSYGFITTRNAGNAHYALQANILFANEVSAAELAKLDETQFGQDIGDIVKTAGLGAAGGALAGGLIDRGGAGGLVAGAAVGGLLGAAFGASQQSEREKRLLAKQATKFYSLVVDLEIRERINQGVVTREGRSEFGSSDSRNQNAAGAGVAVDGYGAGGSSQSFSSEETEQYVETSEWKRQRARILGKAKGKLIAFEDVKGEFAKKLARAISGVF